MRTEIAPSFYIIGFICIMFSASYDTKMMQKTEGAKIEKDKTEPVRIPLEETIS